MKCRISEGLFAAALFSLSALHSVNAQPTLTTLHTFTGASDGANPNTGLILSGNTLYGTAGGGSSGNGTVFKVNTNGTSFTNLYSFTKISGTYPYFTNSDGAGPNPVILSGNTLYGTAGAGGSSNRGTVFRVNTDGTSFTNLHNFTGGSDGAGPYAGVILSGNTLYGTTVAGGGASNGTVFKLSTSGTGFTTLHSFTPTSSSTNSDGAWPHGSLILSGKMLYGTIPAGGSFGHGTVFAVNTDGAGFTNLHSFSGGNNYKYGGSWAGLILSGNTLYGTTQMGGSSYYGTVFKVNTNGTGFTILHNFSEIGPVTYSNSDGACPYANLILSSNTLYGTAEQGGSSVMGA